MINSYAQPLPRPGEAGAHMSVHSSSSKRPSMGMRGLEGADLQPGPPAAGTRTPVPARSQRTSAHSWRVRGHFSPGTAPRSGLMRCRLASAAAFRTEQDELGTGDFYVVLGARSGCWHAWRRWCRRAVRARRQLGGSPGWRRIRTIDRTSSTEPKATRA
jgi:hypothetical protein